MADRNLLLQLLITAKDDASAVFGKLFSFLDRTTSATANIIRAQFTNLFGGGLDGAMDFEAQLDRVQAKGGYTEAQMQELKSAAQQLGAQFGVSGTQAAQGMESLAAAGLSAVDAIKTLPPVLALAASEQISADAAAQKLIDSLSIMGLGFEDASRMADVLAKGANITTSSASQLAEALTQAGGMARAAGLNLEFTVAALDLLHKNGIKGSEAGTALKAILTSLLDPASKASAELTALGITSRDLGTVLGQLQAKGGAANAAILAFGTEAGPGLRALISEGQAGLQEYTAQLNNAGGAADAAANEMSGNLKAASESLKSAWESLKAALLEPLLEPLAKQAQALSRAFQTALSNGSIQGLQTLLKEFGTGVADSIARALQSFDFAQIGARIEQFAQQAKGSFAYVEGAAVATAGVVKGAFNLITAPINAVLASVSDNISSFFRLLASVEQQASKIGLGTLERANELLRKAEAAKATALDLKAAAEQDAKDLAAAAKQATTAFNGVNAALGQAQETAAAVQPPDFGDATTLEPVTYSLADLAAALERAKTAQQAAAQAASDAEANYLQQTDALGNLTQSEYAREKAITANIAAQAKLKEANSAVADATAAHTVATQRALREIDSESTAITANIKTKAQLYSENQRRLSLELKVATATGETADAAVKTAEAELELARAKGDVNAIATATVRLATAEIAALQAKRAAQEKELQQLQDIAARITDLTQRKQILNATEAGELQNLQQQNPTLQQNIEAKKQDIATTNAQIQTKKAISSSTEQQTQAIQGNTTAQQENIKVINSSGEALQRTNAFIANTRKQMESLSETTKRYYDVQFTLALQQVGMEGAFEAHRKAIANFDADLSASSQKLADYAEAFNAAVELEQQGLERMAFAMNGFAKIDAAVEIASGRAQQAYYQQAAAAERLRVSIETMSVSSVTAATQLNQAARSAENGFKFLDEEDLAGLRQAIADASARMRELQEETRSAQERLLALNAEIAAERGDDATSERLKLQLEQQQALADLETKLAEARAANNKELIRLYEEQERKLQTLYTLKEKNLEQELQQQQQQQEKTETPTSTPSTASTTSKASGGMSSGKVYTLNLTSGNKTLTATTATDPQQFLDELTSAKNRSLA